jgi:hypothetical protein
MAWGARWHLAGLSALGVLGVLAGCSGGGWFAEREAWRREAEVQCLTAGLVRESAGVVRIRAIQGPGMCGADFPLRVSVLGESGPLGFGDELRPPGAIPNAAAQPRWPTRPSEAPPQEIPPPSQSRVLPQYQVHPLPSPPRGGASDQPVSLDAPAVTQQGGTALEPYDYRRPYGAQRGGFGVAPREVPPGEAWRGPPPAVPPLGPSRDALPTGPMPVAVSPAATLACPIVSELDRWIATAVQPAAMRWFGSPVAEIKQISAYSCRGMNGNPNARISEHAFGNALDIASFTLADGRKITVKGGWNGLPEEQGFLRDIQGAACEQFTTVLAPGSNVYHYDHIHVDLMRRHDGHRACNPRAVSGEEVAARAGARYAGAGTRYGYGIRPRYEPSVTGSLTPAPPPRRLPPPPKRLSNDPYEDHRFPALPLAEPGNDGED